MAGSLGFAVFVVFVVLMSSGATAFFARAAWLMWFHPERAPDLQLTKSDDPSVVRAHARAVLPFVGFPLGLTLMFAAFLASSASTGTPQKIEAVFGGLCLAGLLLSLAAHATVAWFNWPKFLAPPHLRGDVGSVTEWWRWRKALRRALAEAAERDAPGHHPDPR